MDKLIKQIELEREHIQKTLHLIDETMSRSNKTKIEFSALAAFLQQVYMGIENILKRLLKHAQIIIPDSASSHKDLLDKAFEANILSEQLVEELDRFRAFRHFFMHGYGFMIVEEKLIPLAKDVARVWQNFDSEIDNYIASLKKKTNNDQTD